MIDTICIYTNITKEIYDIIYKKSIIKTSYSNYTGEMFYNIINDHLEGSYSSSLSVRIFNQDNYIIKIEGSLHKLKMGYNSHNGFTDLNYISNFLIGIVEDYYKIELPQLYKWNLNRVDIAICYDLHNQKNICTYINNLKKCTFPHRKIQFYKDQSLYFSGSTTTLKIYNKLLEFKKHDLKKFISTDFDIMEYLNIIQGYIRFECEIKKRKLLKFFNKDKDIKIIDLNYLELKKIWSGEFMKLLKCNEKELLMLNEKEKIRLLLEKNYKPVKARNLYNFYLSVLVEGLDFIKNNMSSSSFYRNLAELKKLNIDFSQTYNVEFSNTVINFNPFNYKEVA